MRLFARRLGAPYTLCEVMLERIAERTGMRQCDLAPEALALLATYAWPDNVRELRNVLEQATMLSEEARLDAAAIVAVLPQAPRIAWAEKGAVAAPDAPRRLNDAVAETERRTIHAALHAANGNKVTAAKLLGISRATLYEKMSMLELMPENQT